MNQAKSNQIIEIWAGTPPGQPDPSTHFWYKARDNQYRRVCDDLGWPTGVPLISDSSRIYVPCAECRSLYVEDIIRGNQRLDAVSHVDSPLPSVVHFPKFGGSPDKERVSTLEIDSVPVATFARFFEATAPHKVRIVRDSRLYQSDPKGYRARDYYLEFRNTLRQTHWLTNNISTFEAALDHLVSKQKDAGRQEHYRKLGEAYISFWKKRDADFFDIRQEIVPVAGLSIRVVSEVGMRYGGDELALKLSLSAPKPTRSFRQVIQHLSGQALTRNPKLQPLLWDVRREEILPPVPIPRDFQLALEGQAGAFRQIWEGLDKEES